MRSPLRECSSISARAIDVFIRPMYGANWWRVKSVLAVELVDQVGVMICIHYWVATATTAAMGAYKSAQDVPPADALGTKRRAMTQVVFLEWGAVPPRAAVASRRHRAARQSPGPRGARGPLLDRGLRGDRQTAATVPARLQSHRACLGLGEDTSPRPRASRGAYLAPRRLGRPARRHALPLSSALRPYCVRPRKWEPGLRA